MPDYDEPMQQEHYANAMVEKSTLGGASTQMLRNPPVRKILEQRIAEYRKLIEAHEKALAALDASPQTEAVLDTLRKLGI